MKKNYFIIIIFVLILAVVAGFQLLNKSNQNQEQLMPMSNIEVFEPQTNSEGSVTITVIPDILTSAIGAWNFEITLDTHSGELNDDLTKAAVLIADNQNYYPIAWNGDPAGGHHRKGVLRFSPILPEPESITLKILGVGGIKERNFTWQLK